MPSFCPTRRQRLFKTQMGKFRRQGPSRETLSHYMSLRKVKLFGIERLTDGGSYISCWLMLAAFPLVTLSQLDSQATPRLEMAAALAISVSSQDS